MSSNGAKTQWTPGPWMTGLPSEPREMHAMVYCDDALGSRVADCFTSGQGISASASIANARLIAAAPTGFAIAEATYLALLQLPLSSCEWRHTHQHIYAGLRDYIALATGQDEQTVQEHYEEVARLKSPAAT